MKKLLMLLLALNTALASEYRHHATLTTEGDQSHYQFFLPESFYVSGGQAWGGDIRIVNAQQQAVPFAIVAPFDGTQQQAQWQSLTIFPVTHQRNDAANTAQITIQNDGSLFWSQTPTTETEHRTDYLILDSHSIDSRGDQLHIYTDASKPFVTRVTVEASADLQQWQSIAEPQTVAQLQHQQQRISQDTLNVEFNRQPYLRIRAVGGDPLPPVHTVLLRTQSQHTQTWPQRTRQVCGTRVRLRDNTLAVEFDLGARFTARTFNIQLPEENLVFPAQLYVNDGDRQHYVWQHDLLLYRFGGAAPYTNPAFVNAVAGAQYWRLVSQQPQLSWPTEHLRLRFDYEPELIVFVARGPGPYQLRWGFDDRVRGDIAVNDLIPNFNAQQLPSFATATVGDMQTTDKVAPKTDTNTAKTQSRWILWTALLVGVLLLLWMVWRLRGELKNDNNTA